MLFLLVCGSIDNAHYTKEIYVRIIIIKKEKTIDLKYDMRPHIDLVGTFFI